jgi:hypothetical protein
MRANLYLCVSLVLALAIGCEDELPPAAYLIKGRVVYQQQPLSKGNIVFFDSGEPAASTTLAADGSYEVRLVPGRYQVALSATQELPEGLSPMQQFEHVSKERPLVPTRYADYETSGLSAEVKTSDGNVQDFVLK